MKEKVARSELSRLMANRQQQSSVDDHHLILFPPLMVSLLYLLHTYIYSG